MTNLEFNIISHTLGINHERFEDLPEQFSRNYYNYGNEESFVVNDMESKGLIEKFIKFDNNMFRVTKVGINTFCDYYINNILPNKPKVSSSQKKYSNFRKCEYDNFAEYIGVILPKKESNSSGIRFVSVKYPSVKGEYQKNIKLAKISYKNALNLYKKELNCK